MSARHLCVSRSPLFSVSLILISLYLILSHGLNITFGLGGMLNLTHIAVFAIGAYATAILSTDYSLGPLPCFVTSSLVAASCSIILSLISLRLEKDYFAMATLAFAALVSSLLVNWKSLTRGVLGIPGIPRPILFGVATEENLQFLWFIAGSALAVMAVSYAIKRSKLGRQIRAQAESTTFVELDSSILGPGRQLLNGAILYGVLMWNRESLSPYERKV
jgi:branched-chain amino acid transport system permease protein